MNILWPSLLLLAMIAVCHAQPESESLPGIRLRGANGSEIVVAGVLEAHPEGLIILLPGYNSPILTPWDKIDLEHLREDQPTIYYGYLDAKRFNRPFLLKLGVYEGIVSFEESIIQLDRELDRPRFYPLPSNVNYLIEQDPDVIKWKTRDYARYNKIMRDNQLELEAFLRRIYPKDSVIIDDTGTLHYKDRADSVDPNRGETSLSIIFGVLSDTRRPPSRLGLQYLHAVTTLQADVNEQWDTLRSKIPNASFRDGNINHMKLPTLMDESRIALEHMLSDTHLHQAYQQKLSDFTSFVYSNAPSYRQ